MSRITDVQHTIMAAVGGMNVTRTVEGRERYSVNVRHARELRDEPEAIGRILVAAPLGAQIPLTQVADIRFAAGPPMIKSENGLLNSVVFVDVHDRDIGATWAGGTGATVLKRIAAPMVGGMASAMLLTLPVVPVLYSLWRERGLRPGGEVPSRNPDRRGDQSSPQKTSRAPGNGDEAMKNATTRIVPRIACLLVVALPHAGGAQTTDQDAVVRVIDAFHSALARGDSTTALAQLAEDVAILESGGTETLQQYRSGHLRGDMRFAQAVARERGEVSVTVVGDVAWAHSTSVTTGRMGDREIDAQGVELMVLTRIGGRWLIRAIHWSSRPRAPGGGPTDG
jgi:ketosteroid isomerase-like protein